MLPALVGLVYGDILFISEQELFTLICQTMNCVKKEIIRVLLRKNIGGV